MALDPERIRGKLLEHNFSEREEHILVSEFRYGASEFVYLKLLGRKIVPGIIIDPRAYEFRSLTMAIDGIEFKNSYYRNSHLIEFPQNGITKHGRPLRYGFHVSFNSIVALESFVSCLVLYFEHGLERVRQYVDINHHKDTETNQESIIQSRVGQREFRHTLIKYWERCAVLPIFNPHFLRASHIKPWKLSNDTERLDLFNGILLSSNLDIAFDMGYISFTEDGAILISEQLCDRERMSLGINTEMRLYKINKRHAPYLEWHRERIFGSCIKT